jgi:catechol 2,3-dioxygenase-like lactoylglutathione lyase family enzyme
MNWTLEVVCVPVSDVDRAKSFYAERLGFAVDFDSTIGDLRLVQLTPPGSGCSIILGPAEMPPGSLRGLQLVVPDVHAARAELAARGLDVGEVQAYDRDGSLRPARDGEDLNNVGFLYFADPDGNTWAVQQITARGAAV